MDRSLRPSWMMAPSLAQPLSVEELPEPQLRSRPELEVSRALASKAESGVEAGPSDEQMSVDEQPDLARLPAWMRGQRPTGPPDEA